MNPRQEAALGPTLIVGEFVRHADYLFQVGRIMRITGDGKYEVQLQKAPFGMVTWAKDKVTKVQR